MVTPIGNYPIGVYFEYVNISEKDFKNVTALFSRDFMGVLITLQDMYIATEEKDYGVALDKAQDYYIAHLPLDKTDYLFVSSLNEENDIPKDTLADVKSLYYFKDENTTIYREKLKALLSDNYFQREKKKGVLTGSVFIDSMHYDNSDMNQRNQSIIETDSLFLELK